MKKYMDLLLNLGAESAKLIAPQSVVTAPWTIFKCRYGCESYGTNLCCPPHAPSYLQMRAVLECYRTVILFHGYDKKNISNIAAQAAKELFLDGYYKALAFGSGPCTLCEQCGLTACANPGKAIPSMEACGIDVFATARANGYAVKTLRTRHDQNNNFGLLLVE